MSPNVASFVLLSCALFASVCHADVSSLRYNRFGRLTTRLQRQEASPTPYPAAGFRPDRQFSLPRDQSHFVFPTQQQPETNFDADDSRLPANEETAQQPRPDLTYGAPARLRQFAPARQQILPQQTYGAPQRTYGAPEASEPSNQAERLTALKSARLTDNREDQEDEEEATNTSDIEVDSKMEEKKVVAGVPAPAATVAYYPAGAVSFVHPLAAYVQPSALNSNIFAKLQAQPAAYVTSAQLAQQQAFASPFYQPQFAYAAPAQLQAW